MKQNIKNKIANEIIKKLDDDNYDDKDKSKILSTTYWIIRKKLKLIKVNKE